MQPQSKLSRARALLFMVVLLTTVFATPAAAYPVTGLDSNQVVARDAEVRLLGSDGEAATLELLASAFTITPAAPVDMASVGETEARVLASCHQVQASGMALTAEAGRPQLPFKSVLLGVPPGATLDLDVTSDTARAVAANVSVCPAVPAKPYDASADVAAGNGNTADAAPLVDFEIYGKDAFYPAETVRLVELGFVRSQRIVRVEFHPFQFNPVTGEVRVVEQLRAAVRFVGGGGSPVGEPPDWENSFRTLLLNYEGAAERRASSGAEMVAMISQAALPAGWTPPQPGYKISVKEEGIYHLTRAWLAAAGIPVDSVDPRTFRLYSDKVEIAIQVTGEEDGRFDGSDEIVFYGRGVDTRYTDANIYWLTYGSGKGARMGTRASVSGGAAVASYLTSVKKEDNTTYDSNLPMLPGYDHWFGQQIQAVGANKAGSVSVALATPRLAASSTTAKVDVMLGAVTSGRHHVRLYVNPTANPTAVFDDTWDGPTVFTASATFPRSALSATGNNTIKIEIINDFPGRAADIVRLDWVEVGYQAALQAEGDKLLFGGDVTGARRYSVSGYSTTNVDLYDITDPAQVVRITGAVVAEAQPQAEGKIFLPLALRGGARSTATGGSAVLSSAPVQTSILALQFGDNQATQRRYAGWERGQKLTPLSISLDQPSNVQATNPGADYIIVTHADFAAAIQPLVTFRSSQGMRVRVVDVQDVYDEFGGGLMSAEAIRDFIAYAYASWAKPAPSYVLLVGDGTYDFRNYKSSERTFVPPYLDMVDPDAGETATDNRFVAVTGADDLPDLHVGRLPANTAAEATIMVNKILGYEAKTPRPWTKQVLFVSDDLEGGGGDFYAYSDGIADGKAVYNGAEVKILPADYTANKVYLGKTCDLSNPSQSIECRNQIIDKLNSGSLMVSYVGHGVKTYWAAERLYDANSLANITNVDRLPVMLPMTCNEGYFIDPGEPSLSELGVRLENRGAIASWSPTGFGLAPGHDYLERGLFLAILHEGKTIGSAATAAKLYLAANAPPGSFRDLIDTFLLLGDPALQVK